MGPNKLFASLSGEGFKTTLEECQDLFRRYKETFKPTIAYLEAQKSIARKNLRMVNGSGRHRRWRAPNNIVIRDKIIKELGKEYKNNIPIKVKCRIPNLVDDATKGSWAKIERDGANFMVQSENVEWTKESMYEIRKELKRLKYDARFYNSVYDETVLDTPKSCAQEVHALQKKIMIECGQRHMKKVPVDVEGHLEPCWTK